MHPEPHTCIDMIVMCQYARTQKHRGTNQLRHLEVQFPTDVCQVQPDLHGVPGQAHGETHTALTSHLTYLAVPDVAGRFIHSSPPRGYPQHPSPRMPPPRGHTLHCR